jgi:quercetin dioxygenase-like cupin family protein
MNEEGDNFEFKNQSPQKITIKETRHFVRDGFEGFDYGDGTMLIKVHGKHPTKRIDSGERKYTVAHIKGSGEFYINGQANQIKEGDKFILPVGSEYSYKSEEMTLIEENTPDTKTTTLDK